MECTRASASARTMELDGSGDGLDDRLDAGQVGYGEGQADYKTQDQDKDRMGEAREATPGVDDRKISIRIGVSHTATAREESLPVCPAALSSASSGPQTSFPGTPRPYDRGA